MNYTQYKNARTASWQALLDCGITELPVSVTEVCQKNNILLSSYEKSRDVIRAAGLTDHMENNDGFSLYLSGCYFIFYDGSRPNTRCRFTVAHELGHILLGHFDDPRQKTPYTVLNREPSDADRPLERAANVFASRLLAPACVLWALGVTTAEEIEALCGISWPSADFRLQRLNLLYDRDRAMTREKGRGCFLRSPLEQEVYKQFSPFIARMGGSVLSL